MTKTEDIQKIAKQVLTAPAFDGQTDNWLWDRVQRIDRNVDALCLCREIQQANMPIDMFCLKAAVYFFQAGLVRDAGSNRHASSNNSSETDLAQIARLSALVVTKQLDKVIDSKKIEKINNIITQSCEKTTRLNEAKVLSDAINLDDIGAVGVFNQVRAATLQKKSISELLSSYKKKADYGYWQARLNESFHFKNTANIANKRFAITKTFMENLEKESVGSSNNC